MKRSIPLTVATVAVLFVAAGTITAQFPTPTPPVPITISSIKVRKLRTFPADVEIQTSLGNLIGTANLRYGPTVCTSVAPCLSGTLINTQYRLENVNGMINNEAWSMSQGVWISYDPVWEIPYFYPFGRPIRKTLAATVFPTSLYFNRTNTPTIDYAAPVNMTGTAIVEMAPLKRFQSPRPFTEFVSIDIDLSQMASSTTNQAGN